jgi:hypothetical protein
MRTRTVNKGEKVISRDGKLEGTTSGSYHRCTLSGCNGVRISVKWSDGKHTFPCSRGMEHGNGLWKIV